eukprot:TRINITY_DN29413_c0_g1_i1.p1 TRINITY_DN29413_c0_g1~~TRINITY_DN29413_c0_g1_i1.p1  ORF type:complete len:994 (-),score=184.40 TRINITY_DN29413_c0_g1_i1:76-3057(-)
MQGPQAYLLRERRAAAARGARDVRNPDHSVITQLYPDAPAPTTLLGKAGTPKNEHEGRKPAKAQTSRPRKSDEKVPADFRDKVDQDAVPQPEEEELPEMDEEEKESLEMLQALGKSDQFKELRKMVKNDRSVLESFLEEITESNPMLMRAIASHQRVFLAMLTDGLSKEGAEEYAKEIAEEQAAAAKAEDPTEREPPEQALVKVEEVPDPSKKEPAEPPDPASEPPKQKSKTREKTKLQEKAAKAFAPTTKSMHTLVNVHSPYSCAVCKKVKTLQLCSSCQCVRFCCKEHQRQFWPRHQSVCKFISSVKGGLLSQVSGMNWMKEAVPKIVDVWVKSKGVPPQPWELEQLIHLPHCRVCRKVPASLVCQKTSYVGYCSEACRSSDTDHTNAWQRGQVGATGVVISYMHQGGQCFPYKTRVSEEAVPKDVYDIGWKEYVAYSALAGVDDVPFLKLPPVCQQTVIDALSFPLIAMEALYFAGRPIERLSIKRQALKVHVLGAYGATIADAWKYEEWLHRGGLHLKTMELHFVGPEVPVSGGADSVEASIPVALCPACKEHGRSLTVFFHRCTVEDFLEEEAAAYKSPPSFRIIYSAVFGKYALGDPADTWEVPLRKLSALQDNIPLIVCERTIVDLTHDRTRAKQCGFKTVVRPNTSRFPSPLTLYDEMRSLKENPIGLTIWNMSFAVFQARATEDAESEDSDHGEVDKAEAHESTPPEAKPDGAETAAQGKKTEAHIELRQDEIPQPENFKIGEVVITNQCERGVVIALRCPGYLNSVQVELGDGSKKHFLPEELLHIIVAESANSSALPPTETVSKVVSKESLVLSLKGPWTLDGSGFEDVAYSAEANPSSFAVTFSVRCDGGIGFRSPLTSRSYKPSTGYIFYVDNDDRWAFWIGDGVYWTGLRGPPMVLGDWTTIRGSYDANTHEVSLSVNGECVETRSGVAFVPNEQHPLRIGAGRSENPVARYFFQGSIRDICIYRLSVEESGPSEAVEK